MHVNKHPCVSLPGVDCLAITLLDGVQLTFYFLKGSYEKNLDEALQEVLAEEKSATWFYYYTSSDTIRAGSRQTQTIIERNDYTKCQDRPIDWFTHEPAA